METILTCGFNLLCNRFWLTLLLTVCACLYFDYSFEVYCTTGSCFEINLSVDGWDGWINGVAFALICTADDPIKAITQVSVI